MAVKWEIPLDDGPGSLKSFGRQLRGHLARADIEDGRMAELIGRLHDLPILDVVAVGRQ